MARTHLRPEHFGEPLICSLLQRIAETRRLTDVKCFSPNDRTSISLAAALEQSGFDSGLHFHDNVPLAPIPWCKTTVAFDGLSRIDCVIEDTKQAAAVEIKLGTTRMTGSEFGSRFLSPCQCSNHRPIRVKGNMIAVLDGRFVEEDLEKAQLNVELKIGGALPLVRTWILVLRAEVWRRWETRPPTFLRTCYVVLFEDLVPAVGGPTAFDEIVRQLVGNEFAAPWGLCQ